MVISKVLDTNYMTARNSLALFKRPLKGYELVEIARLLDIDIRWY